MRPSRGVAKGSDAGASRPGSNFHFPPLTGCVALGSFFGFSGSQSSERLESQKGVGQVLYRSFHQAVSIFFFLTPADSKTEFGNNEFMIQAAVSSWSCFR